MDNDCDQDVDEDFVDLGDVCTEGFGECASEGQKICKLDGSGTECDAVPGPSTAEICDGLDNDCDGLIPDDEVDVDEDTYLICEGDCDDGVATTYPGAAESCDEVDNDCDEEVDEDFDEDGDTYTSCGGDCDDMNPSTYPDAIEVCDGVDSNCNGIMDEDDDDSDGFMVCQGDCNDFSETTNPTADEICGDEIDNDCDGYVDDFDSDCFGCFAGDIYFIPEGIEQIQEAIDRICDGYSIKLQVTQYTTQGLYEIEAPLTIYNRSITLEKEGSPEDEIVIQYTGTGGEHAANVIDINLDKGAFNTVNIKKLIIQGNGNSRGIGIVAGSNDVVNIESNVITGNTSSEDGAGMLVHVNGSDSLINITGNLIIYNETNSWMGGGIFASIHKSGYDCGGLDSEIVISNNGIVGNTVNLITEEEASGGEGGGIRAEISNSFGWIRILSNVIKLNEAKMTSSTYEDNSKGGAVTANLLNASGRIYIINNVVRNNKAALGGGFFVWTDNSYSRIQMHNNTIDGNEATLEGGAIRVHAVYENSAVEMINNLITNHEYGGGVSVNTVIGRMILDYNGFFNNKFTGPEDDAGKHYCVVGSCGPLEYIPSYFAAVLGLGAAMNNMVCVPRYLDPYGDDFHLGEESTCIDQGLDLVWTGGYYWEAVDPILWLDKDSAERIVDHPDVPDSDNYTFIDFGAYEKQVPE